MLSILREAVTSSKRRSSGRRAISIVIFIERFTISIQPSVRLGINRRPWIHIVRSTSSVARQGFHSFRIARANPSIHLTPDGRYILLDGIVASTVTIYANNTSLSLRSFSDHGRLIDNFFIDVAIRFNRHDVL